jgi:hypothetical protein
VTIFGDCSDRLTICFCLHLHRWYVSYLSVLQGDDITEINCHRRCVSVAICLAVYQTSALYSGFSL